MDAHTPERATRSTARVHGQLTAEYGTLRRVVHVCVWRVKYPPHEIYRGPVPPVATRIGSLRLRAPWKTASSRKLADWLNPTRERKVHSLVDKVYKRKNLEMAWERVKASRGAGGVDGVSTGSPSTTLPPPTGSARGGTRSPEGLMSETRRFSVAVGQPGTQLLPRLFPESGLDVRSAAALQQCVHDVLVGQTGQIAGVEREVGGGDAARSQRLPNGDVQEPGPALRPTLDSPLCAPLPRAPAR